MFIRLHLQWFSLFLWILFPVFINANHQELLCDSLYSLNLEVDENLKVEPLRGGVTNLAYRITGKNLYFAKFSFDRDGLIGASLQQEHEILNQVAILQIAPKPIYFDLVNNFLITEFVVSTGEINLRDKTTLKHCCKLLKSLHASEVVFKTRLCPFGILDVLLKNAITMNAVIPEFLVTLVEKTIKEWEMDDLLTLTTPCHLDLHSRNLIQGNKLWMIDWEYAAQSNPWYDLAVVASGEQFSDLEMENLLETYVENCFPSQKLKDHLWKMRILADARWALWSYIQEKISPLDFSFRELGDYYTNECRKRIFTGPAYQQTDR